MAYSPASVTTSTSGLNHLASIYYDRLAVDNFKANLPYYEACDKRTLPMRSGKTIQLFGYNLLAANTTPGTEGTVGAGINPTTSIQSTTVQQYFDFMSFSDLLEETAIDPIIENASVEMGYRAALTVNSLVSAGFDVAVAADASAAIDLGDNEFFNAAVARQMVMSLRGKNVRPKADCYFYGLIHPFAAYDLINDNTAGGVIDMVKYTEAEQLQRGIQGYRVIDVLGCKFMETTTVPTSSNFPSSGKTGYSTYVVGKDAVFAVNLGKTQIPGEKNFNLIARNYQPGSSVADPAG